MTITDPDTERGLYGKYRVERVDGKDKGPYFVLAPNTDPFAVDAIEAYAAACENTHRPLAEDLLAWRDRAQELHPEHFPPPQPPIELIDEERRRDDARAMGPQLADRLERIHGSIQQAAIAARATGDTVRERAFLDALILFERAD